MTAGPYLLADAREMFAVPVPRPLVIPTDGPEAPAPGRAIFDYLRVAAGRDRASLETVAVALAVRDLWTSRGDPMATTAEADELITIAVATAGSRPTDSDAGEVVRLARQRLENVVEGDPAWRELWEEATALGKQTGFRIEIDAARAELIWRSLIAFAASTTQISLPPVSADASVALRTVRSRVEATAVDQFAAIKREWRTLTATGTTPAELSNKRVDIPTVSAPEIDRTGQDAQRLCVWFGTNREPSLRSDSASRYSNSLAPDELFFGRCIVNVPMARDATGGLRRYVSGWLRRGSPHGTSPSVEARLRFANEKEFVDDLEAELALHTPERTALVFIHGYNTPFDRAAASAAQLSVNIKHTGPTAMFSWASRGNVLRYRHDEVVVDASRKQLIQFLQALTSIAGLEHIDLVAHSLGNRLFLRSLMEWFGSTPPSAIPLRNLFLGAPDVAQSEMLRSASVYARAATKTTMYGSDSDSALFASKLAHGDVRAGLMPPPLLAAGIDTIETSAIDTSKYRHNGLVDASSVQTDIFLVQDGKLDPDTRPSLHRVSTGSPVPYWRF